MKLCSCGEYIKFLWNPETQKHVPVGTDWLEEDDTEFDPSRHVNHFQECEDADHYTKRR